MSWYIISIVFTEPGIVAGPFYTQEAAEEALRTQYRDDAGYSSCTVVERPDSIDWTDITRSVAGG